MEKEIAKTDIENSDEKELYVFKKVLVLFLVGLVFSMVSTLALATSINGVPQILSFLAAFHYVGLILSFISFFIARKINKSFLYAFITLTIYLILIYVVRLCESSVNAIDNQIGKGFNWSASFVECIYHLYFFYGCFCCFKKHNLLSGAKRAKPSLIIFACLFFVKEVFEYLSTAGFVRRNHFANRFFLYGHWGLVFLTYLSVFIIAVSFTNYLKKQIKMKEEARKDE